MKFARPVHGQLAQPEGASSHILHLVEWCKEDCHQWLPFLSKIVFARGELRSRSRVQLLDAGVVLADIDLQALQEFAAVFVFLRSRHDFCSLEDVCKEASGTDGQGKISKNSHIYLLPHPLELMHSTHIKRSLWNSLKAL